MALTSDACPRCGATVLVTTDPLTLRCPSCKAMWGSARALEREQIARDLAGTRAAQVTAGYLEDDPDACKVLLKDELTELVALVQMQTYENVLKNLDLAIKGRKVMGDRLPDPERDQIEQQVLALVKMRDWVFGQMMGYEVKGASSV